ncbi:unnamed protein product [Mytilus coruscus]|uniref:Nuclease HARBI1 n=1 Tax=Mytilus coruscus TaxID=42192 RepID=A0A6J8EK54_MYTCO|nr:unnamed protein product [Mytilus coruscus]
MSRQCIPVLIIQQQNANYTLMYSAFYHLMSADGFLHNFEERRSSESIPRIENYYELTVPRYSPDDFKMHFRLTRATFESTCSRISRQVEFNRQKGPTPNVQNELLMFIWYIGNMESFRSMADRFETSKGSYHANIKRMSSVLVSVMPAVEKWSSTPQEFNTTSGQFSERSQLQNVIGAIDGCHIQIKAPKHQPHAYFNREKFYSIVLLGC